jgi:hypothetical protein
MGMMTIDEGRIWSKRHYRSEKRPFGRGSESMLLGKNLLDAGKVICSDGKTFWTRKSPFPSTERPFGPGKSLSSAGKTFWALGKVFSPGESSILSGKDLLPGAGSHSAGELVIYRR